MTATLHNACASIAQAPRAQIRRKGGAYTFRGGPIYANPTFSIEKSASAVFYNQVMATNLYLAGSLTVGDGGDVSHGEQKIRAFGNSHLKVGRGGLRSFAHGIQSLVARQRTLRPASSTVQ